MKRLAIAAIGVLALAPAACADDYAFDNQTCATFMAGYWAGEGTVRMGRSIEVKNSMDLRADGTFDISNAYVRKEGGWEEQKTKGTWSAKPGTEANQCLIALHSVIDESSNADDAAVQVSGSFTTETSVTVTGPDTYETMGFEMTRQPAR